MDDMLAAALEYYQDRGELSEAPVPATLEREKTSASLASPLRYPGKLASDLAGKRLFISDSNNHRWHCLPAVKGSLIIHGSHEPTVNLMVLPTQFPDVQSACV